MNDDDWEPLRELARYFPDAFARAALATELSGSMRANAARLAVEALLTAPPRVDSLGKVPEHFYSLAQSDDALVRLGVVEGLEDAGQDPELQSIAQVLLQQLEARETDPGVQQSIRIAFREIGVQL